MSRWGTDCGNDALKWMFVGNNTVIQLHKRVVQLLLILSSDVVKFTKPESADFKSEPSLCLHTASLALA